MCIMCRRCVCCQWKSYLVPDAYVVPAGSLMQPNGGAHVMPANAFLTLLTRETNCIILPLFCPPDPRPVLHSKTMATSGTENLG